MLETVKKQHILPSLETLTDFFEPPFSSKKCEHV